MPCFYLLTDFTCVICLVFLDDTVSAVRSDTFPLSGDALSLLVTFYLYLVMLCIKLISVSPLKYLMILHIPSNVL